tara:strand:- start:113 stop:331 length:219 start_codon:yes stop_codon:yes gene_type:complete
VSGVLHSRATILKRLTCPAPKAISPHFPAKTIIAAQQFTLHRNILLDIGVNFLLNQNVKALFGISSYFMAIV